MNNPAEHHTDQTDASVATAVAAAFLEALGGDDPDAVADLVAPDFVNEHQNALGTGCVGRETYRERLTEFFSAFQHRRYDVERMTTGATRDDGTTDVVARYHFHAQVTVTNDDSSSAARLEQIDIPGVMWIEVVDGAITRRVDTWDALTYFLQSGDVPPGFVHLPRDADTNRPATNTPHRHNT